MAAGLMCVLAAALATPPAPAPAPPSADARELDRVVVTARRRSELIDAVPGAVTAVSGDALEARAAQDIGAVGALAPNVLVGPARSFNGSATAFIRGIGQFDSIWGVEPGVGIYLDDVPLARPQGALLDLVDVERVEVLRGPQGTLYGRNTLAGAIKLVTRAPGARSGGRATWTVGAHDRRDARLVVDLPVADALRGRIAIGDYAHAGYGRNLSTGRRTGARDASVARLTATWAASEALDVRLAIDRLRDRSDVPPARRLAVAPAAVDPDRTPLDPGPHDVRSDAPERLALDNAGAAVTLDWRLAGSRRLRAIAAWRRGDSQAVLDMDSLARPLWVLERDFRERQASQELQLHDEAGPVRWVVGAFHFDGTEAGDGRSAGFFHRPTPYYRARGAIRTRSSAVYGHATWPLGRAWELDAGLRYTVEHKAVVAYNASYADRGFATPAAVLADFDDATRQAAATPRLAIAYRPRADRTFYVQASRGFKGGSYNVRANAAAFPDSVHPLDPETVTAYEAGAKSAWLDGRATLALALFRNDYRDIQLSVLADDPRFPAGFPDFRNAGRGTTQGAELEARARLAAGIEWSAHVGYLDARYDRYVENGVDVAGSRRFPNAPRWTAGLGLGRAWALGRAGGLRARVDARAQGETRPTTDLTPLLRQPGYAIWSASLAWTSPDRRWDVALRGDNLADVAYRTSGFAYPFGIVTGYYGPPRTWSLSVARAF